MTSTEILDSFLKYAFTEEMKEIIKARKKELERNEKN
jgi:hypothetical protein